MSDPGIATQDGAILQAELTAKLGEWFALKGQIAALGDRENELRKEIFAQAFPDAKEKGTMRCAIGYGKELKAVAKLNYTVSREGLSEALRAGLNPDVHDAVIKYKPEVVESELLRITDPGTKMQLAGFITSKPGMPSLEIVDAKQR